MTNSAIWTADWPSRVREKVRALGYESITDFLADHPAEPYVDVARKLGGVAAVQLRRIQRLEIRNDLDFRRAAMDCIARETVTHLPKGWGVPTEIPEVPNDSMWKHLAARGPLMLDEVADRIAFQTSGVYAAWMTLLQEYAQNSQERADAVWAALHDSNPPTGWLPTGPDDAIIVAAFDKAWPIKGRQKFHHQSYGLFCPKCTAVLTPLAEGANLISCPHCGEQIV